MNFYKRLGRRYPPQPLAPTPKWRLYVIAGITNDGRAIYKIGTKISAYHSGLRSARYNMYGCFKDMAQTEPDLINWQVCIFEVKIGVMKDLDQLVLCRNINQDWRAIGRFDKKGRRNSELLNDEVDFEVLFNPLSIKDAGTGKRYGYESWDDIKRHLSAVRVAYCRHKYRHRRFMEALSATTKT